MEKNKTHCARCGIAFNYDDSTVLTIRPIHYNAKIRAKVFKLCPQCNVRMRNMLDNELVYVKLLEQQI